MRTQDEIAAHLKKSDSMFGFDRQVLRAKEFLKKDAKKEEWDGKYPTEEEVLASARDYMLEYGRDQTRAFLAVLGAPGTRSLALRKRPCPSSARH